MPLDTWRIHNAIQLGALMAGVARSQYGDNASRMQQAYVYICTPLPFEMFQVVKLGLHDLDVLFGDHRCDHEIGAFL